jgi:hypothetical protein
MRKSVLELIGTDAYKWRSRIYYRILEGLNACHGKAEWNGRCAALTLMAEQTEQELTA